MVTHYVETGELVSGKMGTAYIKINNETYELANLKEITATVENTIVEEQVLGKTMNCHKVIGSNGNGTATFLFNQTTLRKFAEMFKDTGTYLYFDLVVENNDPSTTIGSQKVYLRNCCFKQTVLARLDVSATESLTEQGDFFFDDYVIEEPFTTDYKVNR